jgi:hypothetical protein
VSDTKEKSETPSNDGSNPVRLVNLVLTEKEAIACQMLYVIGVAALVRDASVLVRTIRNVDKLLNEYFTPEEKLQLNQKHNNLCDAISPELMNKMHLSVAEWE